MDITNVLKCHGIGASGGLNNDKVPIEIELIASKQFNSPWKNDKQVGVSILDANHVDVFPIDSYYEGKAKTIDFNTMEMKDSITNNHSNNKGYPFFAFNKSFLKINTDDKSIIEVYDLNKRLVKTLGLGTKINERSSFKVSYDNKYMVITNGNDADWHSRDVFIIDSNFNFIVSNLKLPKKCISWYLVNDNKYLFSSADGYVYKYDLNGNEIFYYEYTLRIATQLTSNGFLVTEGSDSRSYELAYVAVNDKGVTRNNLSESISSSRYDFIRYSPLYKNKDATKVLMTYCDVYDSTTLMMCFIYDKQSGFSMTAKNIQHRLNGKEYERAFIYGTNYLYTVSKISDTNRICILNKYKIKY